jgi:predicted patatin/cPLA2 family phospholipase
MVEGTDNTALIIGPGGLRGAYNAGAAVQLGRTVGTDAIDSVYASSVGVYMGAFFAAEQFHPIEHVWRNLVHGDQLVDIKKVLVGRSWLDLEYLVDVLSRDDENTRMDTDKATQSDTNLIFTLTNSGTGEAVYVTPTQDNIFQLMTASCAVPFMHPAVTIDNYTFIDGGIADPLPIEKAFNDGHDRIIVFDDKPVDTKPDSYTMWSLSWLFWSPVADKLRSYAERMRDNHKTIENDPRITSIRPRESLPMQSFMDTHEKHINETFDRGLADAAKVIQQYDI